MEGNNLEVTCYIFQDDYTSLLFKSYAAHRLYLPHIFHYWVLFNKLVFLTLDASFGINAGASIGR